VNLRRLPLFRIALATIAAVVAAVVALRFVLPPSVVVIHPWRGPAVQAVYATGTVEASVMLPIAARITARLVELDRDEGQRVRKGDVIGRLEDTDLKQALAQLRSQETFAHREYERNAALEKTGVIARNEFDRSRSAWQAASAASTKAAEEVKFAKLIAPADGTIIHRDGEIGQLIPLNQAVFWIAADSPPRISAEVDEEDIARVQPGQEVLIRADAFPGRIFHGRVQSVTPKGDAVARSYRVRVAFSEDTPLMIGMTAETNIVVRKADDALLIPSSAVRKNRVWHVRNDRLESSAVTIGAKGADAVEILSGVTLSDTIVAAPDESLHEGQRVRSVLRPVPVK
jgi:RND family efflux transporter MFP subunit